MDIDKFLSIAKLGVVTVIFHKVDTNEIRIMPCTLNNSICEVMSKMSIQVKNQSSKNEYICVWAIDRGDWRDFKVSTVIDWYPGYPKCENQ